MQMGTFDRPAPAHVRLRNVSAEGLEFQIEAWDTAVNNPDPASQQFHGWETVNYVIVEAGDHLLPGNVRILAETVDISADGSGLFKK